MASSNPPSNSEGVEEALECGAVLPLLPVVYGFADFTDFIVLSLLVEDLVDLSVVFGSLDFEDFSSLWWASFLRLMQRF